MEDRAERRSPLVEALTDVDWRVRNQAVKTLIKVHGPSVISPLISSMESDDPKRRELALKTLTGMGEKTVDLMILALKDKDSNRRNLAATVLGDIGDIRATQPLIEAMEDEDENVRYSAVGSLGKIGDSHAVDALVSVLEGDDIGIKYFAIAALGNIGDSRAVEPLVGLLENDFLRQPAMEALGKIGDERAAEPILKQVESLNEDTRDAAMKALVDIDKKIGAKIRLGEYSKRLKDKNARVRQKALERLGEIRDEGSAQYIIEALKDEDWGVRKAAVEALIKLGDKAIIAPLVTALRDEDAGMRNSALEALARIGSQAVWPLIESLRSEDKDRRILSANTLGEMGDSRAVPALIEALNDEDENVRYAAVESLGKIGDPRATEALIPFLDSEDMGLQYFAIDALGLIGDPKAVGPLLSHFEYDFLREPILSALGQIGDKRGVKEVLKAAFGDEDEKIRNTARTVLFDLDSRVGDMIRSRPDLTGDEVNEILERHGLKMYVEGAVEEQVEGFYVEEEEVQVPPEGGLGMASVVRGISSDKPWVKKIAIETLIKTLGLGVTPSVESILKEVDPGKREGEERRLWEGGEETLRQLISSLSSEDPYERMASAALLGELGFVGNLFGGFDSSALTEPLAELLDDNDERVRLRAIEAISKVGGEDGVPLLLGAFEDSSPEVRYCTVKALGLLGSRDATGKIASLLNDSGDGLCLCAIEALGRIGDERAIDPLMTELGNEERLKSLGVKAVVQINTKRSLVLRLEEHLKNLRSTDEALRKATVEMLGDVGDMSLTGYLVEALDDVSPQVRRTAISSLDRLREYSITRSILADPAIDELPPDDISSVVLSKLEMDSLDSMISSLNSEDSFKGFLAADALGTVGEGRVLEGLTERLKVEEDGRVRIGIIEAIGSIGDKGALPPLLEVLEGEEVGLKYFAVRALGDIGDASAIEPVISLLNDPLLWLPCIEALGKMGSRDDLSLVEMLSTFAVKNNKAEIRTSALDALYQIDPQLPGSVQEQVGVLKEEKLVSKELEVEGDEEKVGRSHIRLEEAEEAISEEKTRRLQAEEARAGVPEVPKPSPGKGPARGGVADKVSPSTEKVRVSLRQLNEMMDLVGELVTDKERLEEIESAFRGRFEDRYGVLAEEFNEVTGYISRIIGQLREGIMRVRMIPVSHIFEGLPRLVRDLSRRYNKKVYLSLHGGDTELDKAILDEIRVAIEILIAAVVEHSIEEPDERKTRGKNPEGNVWINAYHKDNQRVIQIEDNGRGVNLEKIHEMEVVRERVSRISGLIDISTHRDIGTRVILKLPLTLAIIQALLVKVEEEIYAIPLPSIVETLRVFREQIRALRGHEVIQLRGRVLPLLRLSEFYSLKSETSASSDHRGKLYIVVVGSAQERIGLVVDGFREQQEVVIKPLSSFLKKTRGILGTAITGDGRVTLILDVADLIRK